MRRGTILTLGASAAFGVLALFLARGMVNDAVSTKYIQSRSDVAIIKPKALETTKILVADMALRRGEPLMQQSLRFAEFPKSSIPDGAIYSFDDLFTSKDNSPVLMVDVERNEPLLLSKIDGMGRSSGLSALIESDKRAVAIRVNDASGVAGFVLPGNRVDVVLIQETEKAHTKRAPKNAKGVDEATASLNAILLAQDVKVLAVDQLVDSQGLDAKTAKTVTLEVDQLQAQKLVLARAAGQLSLVLRGRDALNSQPGRPLKVSDLSATKAPVKRKTRRKSTPRTATINANPSNSVSVTVIRDDNQRDEVRVFRERESEVGLAGGSL